MDQASSLIHSPNSSKRSSVSETTNASGSRRGSLNPLDLSRYSSKESLTAPQVNPDAPSTSGNQSRGTPPTPPRRVVASSMKSSKYNSNESLTTTPINVDAPSRSGNKFQRTPSVSSSSGHFEAEKHGLSSSQKSSKYSSKESLTAPQVNSDAPSTFGNQFQRTTPASTPVVASFTKSSQYSSKDSLTTALLNVNAPSTSGNQFKRRPSVSSSSSGHFGGEEPGLMSSQKSSKYSSKESLTAPQVNSDAPSTSGNQSQRTTPAPPHVGFSSQKSVSSASSGHIGGEDRGQLSSQKSSRRSSRESFTASQVNIDAPSTSAYQFQQGPPHPPLPWKNYKSSGMENVGVGQGISNSSSAQQSTNPSRRLSGAELHQSVLPNPKRSGFLYSNGQNKPFEISNGASYENLGTQNPSQHSGAENLVPINSDGRNVDLSAGQPKSGKVQEMKQVWVKKTASRSISVGHGFSPVTRRILSTESLADVHGRVENVVSLWGDNINKYRKPASKTFSERTDQTEGVDSSHLRRFVSLKNLFGKSSNKHEVSTSSASKHEEKELEQPLSGKDSVSRRGSVSSRHQQQQSQAENRASLRNPSFSLRDSENRSSCSSTSSGTSTPTLPRCNNFDKALDELRKSFTLVKSYAKPQRRMTYNDSSDSRTSRTSRTSSVSNPGTASNASNASNAGKASSTSYKSKRRNSFLSVDQPSSGASSDSEAGKTSSTGKTGKASSTSYSSKRKEDASSDSAAALEKGNFTWFRFKSSEGFIKH